MIHGGHDGKIWGTLQTVLWFIESGQVFAYLVSLTITMTRIAYSCSSSR